MSDSESRIGRAVLAVGGGALLAWLLFRGSGWGLGRGHSGAGGNSGTPPWPVGPPCRVRLDANGLELDGVRADVSAAVTRCRAAGIAEVTTTGAAIVGAIGEVLAALRDAGVIVLASPDLWELAGLSRPATSTP
jgi:hypothetical protein